jgi:acetyl-CoA C-acetyltransferase
MLDAVDAVHLVHCLSWSYDEPVGRLCDELGISPSHREVSVLAGTAGQRMVNAAAERMLAGNSELALVVGGEALASRRRARSVGEVLPWRFEAPDASAPPIDLDEWVLPTEWAHDVLQPTVTFAALDSARAARRGEDPAVSMAASATLLASMSEVAASNPAAWFPRAHTPAALVDVTPKNRVISTPYTKHMVAIMDVDMAAGLLLATHAKAEELGVPRDQRIYLRGWSFGRDATHLAGRAFLDRSVAMEEVSADALSAAGISRDDVSRFDLYSCFASSVAFALDALGLDADDPRGVTVTGGLPYHGGPSSNYTTHAIATMVEHLREDGTGFGYVSGVGMHMTKHVAGVYATDPGPVTPPDYARVQARIDREPTRPIQGKVAAPASAHLSAVTVSADRSGALSSALAICTLGDGARCYARTTETDALLTLAHHAWVGEQVMLVPGVDDTNRLVLPS